MMDYNNPNEPWLQTGYDPFKGMSDDERAKAGCLQALAYIGMIVLGLLLCALLGSCTTTKYVEVPVVHNDTTTITKHQRDSIWVRDSVMVSEKGDTIRIEKWHTKYVEKQVHDTTYIAKVDTIREVFTNEVEKPLTWWQRTRLHLFNIIGIALILIAVFYIGKWHITKLGGKP
jgi:hypothetical protein